jgi:hypothetical protein
MGRRLGVGEGLINSVLNLINSVVNQIGSVLKGTAFRPSTSCRENSGASAPGVNRPDIYQRIDGLCQASLDEASSC